MNVYELAAILTLDSSGYESGLNSAESKASSAGEKISSAFSGIAKITGVALVAGGTAVGALVKSAVEEYGEYEQLVGGVETLYGANSLSIEEYAASVGKSTSEIADKYNALIGSQNTVFANAASAYKTAGLSANEYMETATSFAASLVSSLGGDTAKAAEMADMAITDMSDNANKMGTDMTSIQNAYNGFAKQNYTMLDNLKLGRTCQIA